MVRRITWKGRVRVSRHRKGNIKDVKDAWKGVSGYSCGYRRHCRPAVKSHQLDRLHFCLLIRLKKTFSFRFHVGLGSALRCPIKKYPKTDREGQRWNQSLPSFGGIVVSIS